MPGNFVKEISSLQHPYVQYLTRLRQERSTREKHGSALLSGAKFIQELAPLGMLKKVLVDKERLAKISVSFPCEVLLVSFGILKKITGLSHPDPVAAEISLPLPADLSDAHFLLILDNISDPGNLGTLLRTALALGWDSLFLTPGSTDPYNDKALRAAKGATFHLKIRQGSYEELFSLLEQKKLPLLVADLQGEGLPSQNYKQVALALGNEARGLHPGLLQRGAPIYIPISNIESLNVASAGAILLHHLKRDA